jgi:hypothetical protein
MLDTPAAAALGDARAGVGEDVGQDANDFVAQELELKTNTLLTRQIHTLTTELHRRATASDRN